MSKMSANGLNTMPGISIAGAGHLLSEDITHQSNAGLNIRIVPASGGSIISIRKDNTYSSHNDLYIINEDKDLGAELGKIITLHYLKT